MASIGYARVSTTDQDLSIQLEALTRAGCSPIRSEKVSGKSRSGRDELEATLSFIRDGDELVVQRLDRLGRNTRDVLNIVHELDGKGASLRILEPAISTGGGGVGRIVITVLGMVAELERSVSKERQAAGIEAAKKAGVYKGSRKRIDRKAIASLRAQAIGPSEIARRLGISRMSVYRELQEIQRSDIVN